MLNLCIKFVLCFRFLNEDGLLLVQGSIDEHHYTIGSAILPVLDIKEVLDSHKNSLVIVLRTVCPTDMTHKVMDVISGGLYGSSKQAGSWGIKMDHNSEVFNTLFYSFEEKIL